MFEIGHRVKVTNPNRESIELGLKDKVGVITELREPGPIIAFDAAKWGCYNEELELVPDETPNVTPDAIFEAVKADLDARNAKGQREYGVGISDAKLSRIEILQHAYEEMLDGAIYLKRAMRDLAQGGGE